jgi:hypothetical protein
MDSESVEPDEDDSAFSLNISRNIGKTKVISKQKRKSAVRQQPNEEKQ